MTTALYTGSFDPIHRGHLALIAQAAELFDEVVIAVLGNPAKVGMFSKAERVALVDASVTQFLNVRIIDHNGMAVEAASLVGADCIVRSVHKEHHDEQTMAAMNRRLSGMTTVFLQPDPDTAWISSTFVRDAVDKNLIAGIRDIVPGPVAEALAGGE